DFRYVHDSLLVAVVNHEKTLNAATINVLIPKDPGLTIVRQEDGQDVKTGRQAETPESLRDNGVPSIYWQETKLHVPGVGTASGWSFRVGNVTDSLPIKFKLGADELGGWFAWEGKIVFGSPQLRIVNQVVESLEGGTAPVDEARRRAVEKGLSRAQL